VRKRAGARCEYCHFPEAFAELRFKIDHVVARKHGGASDLGNVALACFRCNTCKGPNLTGVDPKTGSVTVLFNPRSDEWSQHFRWSGERLKGKTPQGRTTIEVLRINRPDVVALRRSLRAEGVQF